MNDRIVAVLPAMVRPLIEVRLPDWVEARWFADKAEALAASEGAEIGWLDMYKRASMAAAIVNARDVRWLNTLFAGVDGLPLEVLAERGVVLTNGAGLNAGAIAEYVLLGMLSVAKGYREVVHAQDRREWLAEVPGNAELTGGRALLLGYGAIGRAVERRLAAFDVEVTVARRTPAPGALGADQWRARLGEFDWVIIAVPATRETARMIGAAELAAMKPGAVLVNVARGSIVDQDALVAALEAGRIAAAFLDVTDPEPLPAGHPLWALPNAHVTMHLSGRSQSTMVAGAAARFLQNLERYRAGAPLEYRVDLARGY